MSSLTPEIHDSKSEVDLTGDGESMKIVVEQEGNESSGGQTQDCSEDGTRTAISGSRNTTRSDDTKSSSEPLNVDEDRLKDVEGDIYQMLRDEEMIYVSKTRKIVQFILFMILIVVGGFLVLASRGLLFARMVSDSTKSRLSGHGLNFNDN